MDNRITVGDLVFFGRRNGEKTRGIVIKVNQKTFKIKATETRHKRNGTTLQAETIYNVSKSLVNPATYTCANGDMIKLTPNMLPPTPPKKLVVKPNLQVGETVKFELKGRLVSTEVVRVNKKTVTTENGYRVPFSLLK